MINRLLRNISLFIYQSLFVVTHFTTGQVKKGYNVMYTCKAVHKPFNTKPSTHNKFLQYTSRESHYKLINHLHVIHCNQHTSLIHFNWNFCLLPNVITQQKPIKSIPKQTKIKVYNSKDIQHNAT